MVTARPGPGKRKGLRHRDRQQYTVTWRASGEAIVLAPSAREAEAMVVDGLERYAGDILLEQFSTERAVAAVVEPAP